MPEIKKIILEHINHERLVENDGRLFESLTFDQIKPLNSLIWRVYRREISLSDFLPKAQALNLPQFREKIFSGILSFDFFPIADYLQININDWLGYLPEKELSKLKIVPLKDWLGKYLIEENLSLNDQAKKRSAGILEEYLAGIKEEEETIDSLTHSEKVGGAGLGGDAAKRMVERFKKRILEAWNNDEIVTGQKVELYGRKREEKKTGETMPARKIQDKGLLEELSRPTVFVPPIHIYEKKAEEIIRKSGLAVPPDLIQRCKLIIISRLKDVRKASEIRERLSAHALNGGIGLKTEETEKMLGMIEEARSAFLLSPPSELQLQSLSKPPTIVAAPSQPLPPKPPPPAASAQFLPESLPKKPLLAPEMAAGDKSKPPPPKPVPPVKIVSNAAPVPTSSDIKRIAPQAIKIMEGNSAQKIETPPAPVKPSVISAIPQTLGGRAKVEDVSFKPRLVGPLDELREIDIVNFRRLSPKTKVAADKIMTKIELLAQEGYEKKIKGAQAWQKSPLNRLYSLLLGESLNQKKPVTQIIEERKKQNKETLTFEEFKAIMELNRQLQY